MTVIQTRGRPWFVRTLLTLAGGVLFAGDASAQWVVFQNETSTRLSATAARGSADPEEKDYAWGDVDRDGDIDLVVVRKEPFTSPGKRVNILFMNQNGVLVDRTFDYATASDVAGDFGFNTATNDRDVLLVDVDGDDWLDVVTAPTISDSDPKHIGHPRIYRNLGNDGQGNWLGFRYEEFRIPQMASNSGQVGFNPRFCSVAAGDLNGDGLPELWFGDYDSSGAGGNTEPPGADFDDRLLVNFGGGIYKDQTLDNLLGTISIPNSGSTPFRISAFGAAEAIADMNNDGVMDIIKQTSLSSPTYVAVAYNNTANEGTFNTYEVVYQQSPYFISVGDLNNDGRQDIVITDDGADRYLLNQGNGPDGLANFVSFGFSFDAAGDDGFGSNNLIADLNNDGWDDVLIADVDVDIGGCSRRMHIYRNLGGTPGGNVTLQEQTTGTGCTTNNNPSTCFVAGIPANMLTGVHDVAVFDINGDGWKDMVIGRCNGTQVWINQPPIGLTFSYPQGLPVFTEPGSPFSFQVLVGAFGIAVHQPGSAKLFSSIDGGPFVETAMTPLGGDLYEATLPAAADCAQTLRFYVTADTTTAVTFKDPPSAPADAYRAIAAQGTEVTVDEGFEGVVTGWTVVNDPSLTSGAWQVAVPVGTIAGGGQQAAPSEDAEAGSATHAFVTQNGAPGGSAGAADVDGGPTDLISPPIDLSGTDASITYSRWFFSDGSDTLTVWVSGDGNSWTLVETVPASGNNQWKVSSFKVGDFIEPTATVHVRFRTSDNPNNSVVEAAIDAFRVEAFVCAACQDAEDCDDGVFCNGAEGCIEGSCVPGEFACPGSQCDEGANTCVDCLISAHCDDGNFCNGAESCDETSCVGGADPCPGQQCSESTDTCVDCLTNQDCNDGLFCNGAESCSQGSCVAATEACPGQFCDEDDDVCIGTVTLQPRMGQPVLGLDAEQFDRFAAGRQAFERTFTAAEGLGPVFNQNSCGSCHNLPLGGSGSIVVTRFGFNDDKGGGFDPLDDLGGSLLQAEALSEACREELPAEANVVAQRVTNSTLGFGLVEAIPDSAIEANAITPPPLVSGRVHYVAPLEAPAPLRAGRFGWKSQVATLLTFSADAALNELGFTNRLIPTENDPNGMNPPSLGAPDNCDTVPDPEDGPDGEGMDFIDRVTDFQRFLAPPPQTPRSAMTGEALFQSVGCASCHTRTFITGSDVATEPQLRGRTIRPYSDFLLHDMGLSADFIAQGEAGARELRTAPLWGLRVRDPLWHDGRVAGGTFSDRVLEAIALHGALGSEAQPSAQAFQALTLGEKAQVVAFLDSLGRAEFDLTGDGQVLADDYQALLTCFTGPGNFYTADDPCAVADVDQDGDVDDDDFALFLVAVEGSAGRVPDGSAVPGVPLRLSKGSGDEVVLSWSASCRAGDGDYAVYEGSIGAFASHVSRQCTTAGITSSTLTPLADAAYFLVVPTNGFREGSYGTDSAGQARPPGAGACLPQSFEGCQ